MHQKQERLAEFYRRLEQAPPAATSDEALAQVRDMMDAVEDELTPYPNRPDRWMEFPRLYPPQDDASRAVPGHASITRYRSRAHNTYIGTNGAIEIQRLDGRVELSKAGANGKGVWEP
jgi:hypothetical protein